jgi:hypothetical protein
VHPKAWVENESKQVCFWHIGWTVLRFHGHERGIEIGQKIINAINKVVAPENKKQLQSLIGKINFIRRFVSNLSGRIQPFSP